MSPDLTENKKGSSRGLKTVRPGNQRCKATPRTAPETVLS